MDFMECANHGMDFAFEDQKSKGNLTCMFNPDRTYANFRPSSGIA
jgi:hypothetical protein